jgi:hypothetical protein
MRGTMKKHIGLWAVTAGVLALPTLALASSGNANAARSVACSRATSSAERFICRKPDLAKAYAAIADSYATLRAKLDPATAAVLADDQKQFMAAGRKAYRHFSKKDRTAKMLVYLADRVEVLNAINPAAPEGFAGTWSRIGRRVDITPAEGGAFNVTVQAGEVFRGRWMCAAHGAGTVFNGVLTVKVADSPWVLLLDRQGQSLTVSAPGNPYAPHARPESDFCTKSNGSVSGRYLSATYSNH